MNNKYRGISVEAIYPPSRDPEEAPGTCDGGMVLATSPQKMELRYSPKSDKVRVELGSLRADNPPVQLGDTTAIPTTKLYGLGEYRYVLSGTSIVEQIYRLYFEGEVAATDLLLIDVLDDSDPDPANWEWVASITDGGTDALKYVDELVSAKGAFNSVFFADGTRVYKWDQAFLVDDEGNDFPTVNSLTAAEDTTDVIVTPAGGSLNKYTVHYSLTVTGPSEVGGYVTTTVEHAGEILATLQRVIPQSSDTARVVEYENEEIKITRSIAANELVTLRLKLLSAPPVYRWQALSRIPATYDWEATPKSPVREAVGRNYTFDFMIGDSDVECTLSFYFDYDGVGYILAASDVYQIGVPYTVLLNADGDTAAVVGFKVSVGDTVPVTDFLFTHMDATWEEAFEVEVHGFNKATDIDAKEGITYSVTGAQANTLSLVRPTPNDSAFCIGRYLGLIADRVVILQYGGDPARIAACASEDPTDWTGDGTVDTILTSRSDLIDDLMALEMLTSNIGALFRKRSIMRVVPTGQLEPALGFYPWIENLGTESPFSVVTTPYGILFLGHDKQIYLLTEGGHQAVGQPINEAFNITDLSVVEGVFDSVTQEYILSIPADH